MPLSALLFQALFTLVLAAVVVGWLTRPATDPAEVTAWADAHGVALTERSRPMITYYVRLAITLRVIGGVAGWNLGSLFDDAFGLDTSAGAGFWIWVVLGWLLGASWAEYRLTRPSTPGPAASLTPRRVSDYLSPRLEAAPAVAAGLTVVMVAVGAVAPDPKVPQAPPPSSLGLALAAVGAVAIAALVTLAVRAVVARRQPATHPEVVAADDAIRASAVHHLAGGGAAAILLIASQVAWSVLYPYKLPFGVRGWVPAVFFIAALLAWRWFAYRGWRVRRAPGTPTVDA